MPELSGLEVCRALRARGQRMPVLIIAQAITLAHGGTIAVTSTLGACSAFTVRLPHTARQGSA